MLLAFHHGPSAGYRPDPHLAENRGVSRLGEQYRRTRAIHLVREHSGAHGRAGRLHPGQRPLRSQIKFFSAARRTFSKGDMALDSVAASLIPRRWRVTDYDPGSLLLRPTARSTSRVGSAGPPYHKRRRLGPAQAACSAFSMHLPARSPGHARDYPRTMRAASLADHWSTISAPAPFETSGECER